MAVPKYKRILLKLSGEAFQGKSRGGVIKPEIINLVSSQIKRVHDMGVEVGVVVGGGNIWRGAKAEKMGIDRVQADYAGMLATIINALVLQDYLEQMGVITRTLSSIDVQKVAEPYIRRRAIRHLEKGRVVIFAGGTGNPYMSTDTAGALRAIEIGADALLLAKNNVDGIYTADPLKDEKAKKFTKLTYLEAINLRLAVMDATALSLCLENQLPIIVFDFMAENSIQKVVNGRKIGTIVTGS